MIPAPFDYVRAESVDQAIELLSGNDDAKIIAGGHSLLPLMRLRLARPALLVDISRLADLAYVREDDGQVAIGALTRHHDVANSEALQELAPIVAYAASLIGDPAVRHVGTIGGSCAHADPASDMPTVLLALGAELLVLGPKGTSRRVTAADFFKGLFQPDLASNEVLSEIRVPKTTGRGWSYLKFHRRAQDWAMVGVAALAGNGIGPAVALTNMGERPPAPPAWRKPWPGERIRRPRPSEPTRAPARRRTRSAARSTAESCRRCSCAGPSRRPCPGRRAEALTLGRASA